MPRNKHRINKVARDAGWKNYYQTKISNGEEPMTKEQFDSNWAKLSGKRAKGNLKGHKSITDRILYFEKYNFTYKVAKNRFDAVKELLEVINKDRIEKNQKILKNTFSLDKAKLYSQEQYNNFINELIETNEINERGEKMDYLQVLYRNKKEEFAKKMNLPKEDVRVQLEARGWFTKNIYGSP